MKLRNEVLVATGDYYQAKLFMSTQRVFHKSRVVENYNCIELEDFKINIEKEKELSKNSL